MSKRKNPLHDTIISLRKSGLSYGAIAEATHRSISTVTAICRRAGIKVTDLPEVIPKGQSDIKVCKNCGEPFVNPWNRYNKKFCSKHCHNKYWNDLKAKQKAKATIKNSPPK